MQIYKNAIRNWLKYRYAIKWPKTLYAQENKWPNTLRHKKLIAYEQFFISVVVQKKSAFINIIWRWNWWFHIYTNAIRVQIIEMPQNATNLGFYIKSTMMVQPKIVPIYLLLFFSLTFFVEFLHFTCFWFIISVFWKFYIRMQIKWARKNRVANTSNAWSEAPAKFLQLYSKHLSFDHFSFMLIFIVL